MQIVALWGIFVKSKDKDVEDMMIAMALSEEVADRKKKYFAAQLGEFESNLYYRRVDQQEYNEDGKLLYSGLD